MSVGLIIAGIFAVLFYRIAAHERMTAWAWALASFGLTWIALEFSGRVTVVLLTQAALFGVLWWYHAKSVGRRASEQKEQYQARVQAETARRDWAQREIERERKERTKSDQPDEQH